MPAARMRVEAETLQSASWTGTLVALAVAAFVVVLVGVRSRSGETGGLERARRWESATARGLTAISPRAWIAGCGVVAGAAAGAVHHFLLAGRVTLADELIQLRHAHLVAGGALADAWPFDPAFRNGVNGVWTAEGWSSVYPPGHTAVLALFARVGAEGWVGPLLTALTASFTAALLLRLLPERPTTARVAAAGVALSPFLWGIGAGYLSHTSAACAVALALWAAVRARDGAAAWALLTGAAAGWATTARPWTGLVLAVALPVGVWLAEAVAARRLRGARAPDIAPARDDSRGFGARDLARRLGWATLGGLPFAVGLAVWNHRLFGSPFRFGYEAAFGPSHALGFHRDPWGNLYGLREAIGYTGADLVVLGRHLFETPIPAVGAVGAWLLIRGRPFRGSGLLFAWAGAAVLANAFYWHHGLHFGPRLLYEAAPAWAALTVLAAVGLGLPRGTLGPEPPPVVPAGTAAVHPDITPLPLPPTARGRGDATAGESPLPWAVVALARVATVVALGWGLAVGLPPRLGAWSLPPASPLPPLPTGTPDHPALVFVHGSWAGREAARLEAGGMRRDSIETALRRNDLCRVHEYAQARRSRAVEGDSRSDAPLPPLDLRALPGAPDGLGWVQLSEGNHARIDPSYPWSASCRREAAADREGTIELATVLARAEAGSPGGPGIWVRDLGPEANARLIEQMDAGGRAYLWTAAGAGGAPVLEEYAAGITRLWGAPGDDDG